MANQQKLFSTLLVLVWISAVLCDELGKYSSHACANTNPNIIRLSCPQSNDPPEANHIRMDNGTYGSYADDGCVSTCCEPKDTDCEMYINQVKPLDWADFLSECNMKQDSCDVTYYDSNSVPNCPTPSVSNFQVIYYTCVLADGSLPTTTTTSTTTTTTPAPTTEGPITQPPTPDPTRPPGGGGTNVGAIIGGVLGGLCVVAIAIIIVLLCKRRQENKKAMKSTSPRPVVIRNGSSAAAGVRKGETPVYDNAAFDNHTYEDEEMIIGSRHVKALSKTYSQTYENVNVKGAGAGTSNGTAAKPNDAKSAAAEGEDNLDAVSQSTGTTYENVTVKANPSPYIEIVAEPTTATTKKENGASGQKFEKKTPPASATTKDKAPSAPVAKKAAPPNPKIGKAHSAMDVSSKPEEEAMKLDKSRAHKQSAPVLSSSQLSTAAEPALNESKAKSASAQELKRRSRAESDAAMSSKEEPIKEEEEEMKEDPKSKPDSADEDTGPGKELF